MDLSYPVELQTKLPSLVGGQYIIISSGMPKLPADRAEAADLRASGGAALEWTITVMSLKGYLQSRSNPGVDPIYLYVYESDVDSKMGGQSVYSVILGPDGPVVALPATFASASVTATLDFDQLLYTPGVYNNLRVGISSCINTLVPTA